MSGYVDSREIEGLNWYQTKDSDDLNSEVWVAVGQHVVSLENRFDTAKNAARVFRCEGYIVTSALLLPGETRLRIVPTENA
jgi:hypothetical protein